MYSSGYRILEFIELRTMNDSKLLLLCNNK